ncbi:MAG: GAF domain-containing protein, partial [Frankia sp.]
MDDATAAPPGVDSFDLRLDGSPAAVPRARRMFVEAMLHAGSSGWMWEAQVAFAELVTNAVLHGRPPVDVHVDVTPDGLRLQVADTSTVMPIRPRPGANEMTGRGLALVDAVSTRWGIARTDAGKIIWTEFGNPPPPRNDGAVAGGDLTTVGHGREDALDEPRFRVSLGDVPTDLLLAAKNHVDNLVREFALAAAGATSGESAAVPPRLADLIHTVTTRFAEPRRTIKQQALAAAARGQERTRLVLELPVAAAEAGEEYLAALDEADAFARATRLLTLETPPQHRAFRRWYVMALVKQLRGAARGSPVEPTPSFERFLLDALGELASAQRLTAQAARLQRVTASLATATTLDEVAAIVVSEGAAALGASGGGLVVPSDDSGLTVAGSAGYPDELVARLRAERPDALLPAAEAMRSRVAVWLESPLERDVRFPDLRVLEPAAVAMCALPLVITDRVLGALRFSFAHVRLFDDDERRFADALAAQTAQSLERARLFTVERQARERITFLAEAGDVLTATLDWRRTLDGLTRLLVPRFADWAVVYILNDAGAAALAAIIHRDQETSERLSREFVGSRLDLTQTGGIAQALRTGATVGYRHVPDDIRRRATANLFDPALTSSIDPHRGLAIPLRSQGRVIGAVGLARTHGEAFDADEQSLVEDLATRAATAVGNARQYERERDTALTLQRSLLPQRLPHVPGVNVAWRYLPAGAGSGIGGDWYDVLPLADGTVALLIGDVMGRGVQAAAVMGQLRATARAYAV